jgi:hypothetical protein
MNDLKERDMAEPFVFERPSNGAYRRAVAPPPPEPPRHRHLPGIVGPTILIGAGAILLLNTTGLVDWDIWAVMWRLWPVILIAIGLDILFGRRSLAGSALVAATMLVVMVGGAWALVATMSPAGQEMIAQPRNGIDRAEVTIAPAVASLQITAGNDGAMLVGGTIDRARGERLEQDYRGNGGSGNYTLKSEEVRGLPFGVSTRDGDDPTWNLQLARDLPLFLKVNSGVGKATIDLTGMQLTGLDVDTGVGQTIITLPATGRFSASVNGGVGEVVVRVPAGMAVRVQIDAGLGDTQVPSGYTRQGDWYVSPGYDTAANRIDLDINGGIGRVAVEEVGGR